MAANFRDWSREGGIEQNEDIREEKKQQVSGLEASLSQKLSQLGASAPPRAKNWALVAAFRGLTQAAHP